MTGTPPRYVRWLAVSAVVSLALGSVGVLGEPSAPQLTVDRDRPQHNTLIGLQGYHDEGRAIEVTPAGEVVWEYRGFDDVFDVEALDARRVQIAGANALADAQCPPRYRDDGAPGCVRNSVRIVDRETNETRWKYAWHDVQAHEHELHDVDHYRVDGEDRWVLVDMGNDRVFAIDRAGDVRWQWNATETYDRPPEVGPDGDWTHANDVDRLEPGVFQVSLRNFDTVVELRVRPNGTVEVEPVIGPNRFDATDEGSLYEQHNPDRLADDGLLVADSEHHRVVEFDGDREVVWEFGGSAVLDWPRDADRLSSGHTLVTDSYNERIVEVNERGEIVWAVETGTLPYDADRLDANRSGEGSAPRPTATDADLESRTESRSAPVRLLSYGVTVTKYVISDRIAAVLLGLGVVCGLGALVGFRRQRR